MFENIISYAKSIHCSDEVINWLETTGKKSLINKKTNQEELEHIIDFFKNGSKHKRLLKMSLKDAKRLSDQWSKSEQKKGKDLVDTKEDIKKILKFKDGSSIVQLLTEKSYKREGFLMHHCVGSYKVKKNVKIYSYRDKKNFPHATFEIILDGFQINQIKGKGNGQIHPKYIKPILKFLKFLKIDIRDSEMKNLGYYFVHKSLIPYIKKIGAFDQLTLINKKYYCFNNHS